MTSPRVLWLGMLEGPSGYADETRGFLRALERAGDRPAARPVLKGGDAPLGAEDRRMLDAQTNRRADDADVVVHHFNPSWVPGGTAVAGAANVARTMFETDRIPRAWLAQLLRRDEIWVPSEAGAQAFERGGIPSSRLRVVGGTLDFDLHTPGAHEPLALPDVPAGHLVFLSNFEFTARKAWRELLAGWARAFAPTDPVCLVLKVAARGDDAGRIRARVDEAVAEAARAAGRAAAAPVRVMTETLSCADLVRLYAAADAYVLPSRGEGWGRPYMEAMAMGLPTIASRFSGNLAFMDDASSWLIDGELVPVPEDHGVFGEDVGGHRWFEPSVEHLAAVLAEIAGDPDAARARAATARPHLVERFGQEATAASLRTALAEVAERRAATGGRGVLVRGPFGRHQSLGLVNDRLLERFERDGRRVFARPPRSPVEVLAAPSISHHWPPDFSAGTLGPSVLILPWEYGDPPAEWVQRVRREADRVVVPSRYVKDGYVAAGMPPGAVEVVPNGVDLDRFTPDGPRRLVAEHAGAACTFLFVGGTLWRKGIDVLLAAWHRAFAPGDGVRLVVKDHGVDTHYRNQTGGEGVREFARRGDVAPVIHLTDDLAPDELPALFRAADVLVHPYRGEGFGLPVLEAMACGVPVVHTAVGPSTEFTGPDAGWAVPARRVDLPGRSELPPLAGPGYAHEVDVDALAAALREAAADEGERQRRGRAAREQATAFGWDRAAADLEAVLATLEDEGLPPVRDVVPERPEGRATLVAYAPDWDDEATWRAALDAWIEATPEDADVTLALCVDAPRAPAIAGRVMAALDGRAGVPDLALHQRPDADPLPLVLGADAVLLDATQEEDPRLVRRAAATLRVADLKRHRAVTTTGA